MTSAIVYSTIDTTFPIPGRDNDSQGFRTNFTTIKTGLQTAASEISILQSNKADLVAVSQFANNTPSTTTSTGALTVVGGVGIGGRLNVGGKITAEGADVITKDTPGPQLQTGDSDVFFTGTYGVPGLNLGDVIRGTRAFTGSLGVGGSNSDPTHSSVMVHTTASGTSSSDHNVAIYVKTTSTYNTSVKLMTHTASGNNFKYLQFGKNDGGIEKDMGSISHDGNHITFTAGLDSQGFKFASGAFAIEPTGSPPASADANAKAGTILIGSDAIYVCVANGTWKKVGIATY
jgi:hypothetical protein